MNARASWPVALILALPLLVAFGPKEGDESEVAPSTQMDKDIEYAVVDGEPLLLDAITTPATDGPRPGVILIHGGGWRRGDSTDLRVQARQFAEAGWATFSIEYRLDESSGHPAEVEDVERSILWVREHAEDYDVDPDQIALFGSSAGGNLAALAAFETGDVEGGPVAAVVSLSGIMDFPAVLDQDDAEQDVDDKVEDYLGCSVDDCPDVWDDASPINHVDAGDPPIFLANGTEEDIPEDQATAMAAVLDDAGVDNELLVIDTQHHGHALTQLVWDPMMTFLSDAFAVPVPSTPSTTASDGAPETADGSTAASEESKGSDDTIVLTAGATGLALVVAVGLVVLWVRRRRPPVPDPDPSAA